MIGLVMLGAIINYLTRSTLAVAAPTLLQDLHISERRILLDRRRRSRSRSCCSRSAATCWTSWVSSAGLAIFATAWSLISMAHGLANNWPTLAGAPRSARIRGRIGQPGRDEGHGGVVPGKGAWARRRRLQHRRVRRARCSRRRSSSGRFSPTTGRWRSSSRAAWAWSGSALWLWLYHSPDKHPALSHEERAHIAAGQESHLRGRWPASVHSRALPGSATSGASRCRACSPTRRGAR